MKKQYFITQQCRFCDSVKTALHSLAYYFDVTSFALRVKCKRRALSKRVNEKVIRLHCLSNMMRRILYSCRFNLLNLLTSLKTTTTTTTTMFCLPEARFI
jgi:hypothetical protein